MHSMGVLQLQPGEVDLWYAFPDAIVLPQLLAAYHQLLSPDEAARRQRFLFEKNRHQFLVTRALVRTVLSQYAEVDPRAWVFTANPHGRPSVAEPAGVAVDFNISHTDGLVVCAVAAGANLGVDAERLEMRRVKLEVARRFFAPEEAAALDGLPAAEQGPGFFQLWTLKEAYIKARGLGLFMSLGDFAFTLSPGRPPKITFVRSDEDDPDRWRFARIRLSRQFQIAVALPLPAGCPLTIRLRESVPLGHLGAPRVLGPSRALQWHV
jgi:4'-phosphopantetheinyl transferase